MAKRKASWKFCALRHRKDPAKNAPFLHDKPPKFGVVSS